MQPINTRMQWFIIAFCTALFLSITASMLVLIMTKNIGTLSIPLIPTPLLLAMHPIVRYLFPSQNPAEKQANKKQIS